MKRIKNDLEVRCGARLACSGALGSAATPAQQHGYPELQSNFISRPWLGTSDPGRKASPPRLGGPSTLPWDSTMGGDVSPQHHCPQGGDWCLYIPSIKPHPASQVTGLAEVPVPGALLGEPLKIRM